MNKPRFLFVPGMILAAAASRLIPYPSDLIYTAVLFGGLRATEWRWPVLRPTPAHQMN